MHSTAGDSYGILIRKKTTAFRPCRVAEAGPKSNNIKYAIKNSFLSSTHEEISEKLPVRELGVGEEAPEVLQDEEGAEEPRVDADVLDAEIKNKEKSVGEKKVCRFWQVNAVEWESWVVEDDTANFDTLSKYE